MIGRARAGRALVLALVALGAAVLALAPAARPRADAPEPSRAGAPVGPAARALARRALVLVSERRRFGHRLVVRGPRRGVRATTDPRTRTITLHVRPGDAPHRVAHDLAHELGHAYALTRLPARGRRAYLARRGVPHARWTPVRGAGDYDVGAGDFAEVFAACHAASPEFRSTLAPRPADACQLLPPDAR